MNRRRAIAAGVIVVCVVIAFLLVRDPRGKEPGPARATPEETKTALAPEPSATVSPTAVAEGSPPPPAAVVFPPILDWPTIGRDDFGCLLERAGHRHPRWNCASAATGARPADPCEDEFLYAGPDIPADTAARISPLLASIELHWDAGHILAMTLKAKPGVTPDALRSEFRLPNVAPNGIRSLDLRECEAQTTCIVVDVGDRLECAGHQPD